MGNVEIVVNEIPGHTLDWDKHLNVIRTIINHLDTSGVLSLFPAPEPFHGCCSPMGP